MDNAELIAALRVEPFEVGSFGLARIINQAADTIEAQQKALDACAKQLADMAAKVPKEGEWMKSIRWYYQQPTRTVATTTDGTTFMCRSTGKPCQNATEYGYCKQTVCATDSARR